MHEIIPGILERDWDTIEQHIIQFSPFAKTLHIDIIDGKFAQNTTFLDPKPFTKYAKDISLELHMMVEEPINYVEPWANAGFRRFIGHVEKMSSQEEFVAKVQEYGEVVLALDMATPIEALKVSFDDLDALLVMTIKAGFSGQQFIENALRKVTALQEKASIPIEVDGGINNETIKKAYVAGAKRFVATSFLHKGDTKIAFNLLMESLHNQYSV